MHFFQAEWWQASLDSGEVIPPPQSQPVAYHMKSKNPQAVETHMDFDVTYFRTQRM